MSKRSATSAKEKAFDVHQVSSQKRKSARRRPRTANVLAHKPENFPVILFLSFFLVRRLDGLRSLALASVIYPSIFSTFSTAALMMSITFIHSPTRKDRWQSPYRRECLVALERFCNRSCTLMT